MDCRLRLWRECKYCKHLLLCNCPPSPMYRRSVLRKTICTTGGKSEGMRFLRNPCSLIMRDFFGGRSTLGTTPVSADSVPSPMGHRARDPSKTIGRTWYAHGAFVQDMSVDHRRLKAGMPEQLLDCANVASALEKVRGERVAKCMTRHPLSNSARPGCCSHGALDDCFMQMMATTVARLPIYGTPRM